MSHSQAFVWSWGAGTRGQLATAAFADSLKPVLLRNFDGSAATPSPTWDGLLTDMACGGAHAVATLSLWNEGEERSQVVTWGNGEFGALGHGGKDDVSVPKVIEVFTGIRIRSVAAGWSHTAFVSLSGVLYTCGSGSFGQLGHGDFEERLIPCKVESLSSKCVKMAACGMRHTLLVTRDQDFGHLFIWGRGFCGESDYRVPRQARHQRVSSVYSGKSHFCGWNHFTDVALGWNHGLALTDDGVLWAWGSNQRGQRGSMEEVAGEPISSSSKSCDQGGDPWYESSVVEDTDPQWPKMARVHGLEGKCLMFSAGSEHSAALCESGEVRVWGWGEHGQLGQGNTADAPLPQVVSLPGDCIREKLTWRLCCGSGFTFVVASGVV